MINNSQVYLLIVFLYLILLWVWIEISLYPLLALILPPSIPNLILFPLHFFIPFFLLFVLHLDLINYFISLINLIFKFQGLTFFLYPTKIKRNHWMNPPSDLVYWTLIILIKCIWYLFQTKHCWKCQLGALIYPISSLFFQTTWLRLDIIFIPCRNLLHLENFPTNVKVKFYRIYPRRYLNIVL